MGLKVSGRILPGARGQATTEYVLLLALVVMPVALAFNQMRNVLRSLLDMLIKLVIGPGV